MLRIFRFQPDFDGGAVGIERGTDDRHFAFDRLLDSGHSHRALVPDFQGRGVALRDVSLGDDGRNIHHRQQGSARRRHFARVKWTVSDDAVDRAANLGIAELRLRSQDTFPWPIPIALLRT